MKQTILKVVSKRFITMAFLAGAAIFCGTLDSKANTNNMEILSNNHQSTVQYIGTADGALIFSVNIANSLGEKFTLIITDAEGRTLFAKEYSDKNFSGKFKLLKEADDSALYQFSIKSNNKSLEKTFEVSTIQKLIEEVVVTPL